MPNQTLNNLINVKHAHKLFVYKDGVLYNRIDRGPARKGDVSGYKDKSDGYWKIGIFGHNVKRSRLVFLMHNGFWPENDIDHIDRDRSSDLIENLREVSALCNVRNSTPVLHTTSGIQGVSYSTQKGKWHVRIGLDNRNIDLGKYACLVEAAAHRYAAEQCLGWKSCNISTPAAAHMKTYIAQRELLRSFP